jgi:hypothetical protein
MTYMFTHLDMRMRHKIAQNLYFISNRLNFGREIYLIRSYTVGQCLFDALARQ